MTPPRKTKEEILNGDVQTCSVPEAMQVLGISRPTVFELHRDGKLDGFYAGRNLKVSVPSLKRLLGTQAA